MKITLEPTRPESGELKVTVEDKRDGLTLNEVMQLIASALLAYQYHPKNVREWIKEP